MTRFGFSFSWSRWVYFGWCCLIATLADGCMVNIYHRKDGPTSVTVGVLMNEEMKRLVIDRTGKTTSTGVSADGLSAVVDDGAVEAITKGVVEGVIQGMK